MNLKQYANLQSIAFDDAVWVDDNGMPGTEYPLGTPAHPVLGGAVPGPGLVDARAICAARNRHHLMLHGVIEIDAAMVGYIFAGHYFETLADYIDLNGQDVSGSRFEDIVVTAAQGGAGLATFVTCILYNMTGFKGMAENCPIYGTLALAAANYADFDGCSSVHDVCTITVANPTRASFKDWKGNLTLASQTAGVAFVRGFDGDLTIDAMTGGTLDIYMREGTVTINANCTGGTINIYGSCRVTDNSVGTIVGHLYLDFAVEEVDDKAAGILVQVPYFVTMDTVNGGTITLFSFDALGCTIREVFISFYMPNNAGTFTLTWEKTRANDLITFTEELVGAPCIPMANIAVPANSRYYSYRLGEIAQGLQGRFRILEDANAGVTVDAFAVVVMEL